MSCWRVLELAEAPPEVPQLLIKPAFSPTKYAVHLTDLSNIWSEELDLEDIVKRASEEDSPIEVSKHDTTQLAILLENVNKSLASVDDSVCRITRDAADGIVLHTTTALPAPLDSLGWKFHLRKRTSVTLKNELILPLLVSSHIQHERISSLTQIIGDKDKAITRLVDQFESTNLDLVAAFPSIGVSKSGRRSVTREQAAKHVPGLQPFHANDWRIKTAQLGDQRISTLGLFQEALSQCTPLVPGNMKSDDKEATWWADVQESLPKVKASRTAKSVCKPAASSLMKAVSDPLPDEEDTDDDFETDEHFKQREATALKAPHSSTKTAVSAYPNESNPSEDESTDDEDLIMSPKNHDQTRSSVSTRETNNKATAPSADDSSPFPRPAPKKKQRGFRIGGVKATKHVETPSPSLCGEPKGQINHNATEHDISLPQSSPSRTYVESTPKKAGAKPGRKPFRIGGKHKSESGKEYGAHLIPSSPTKASEDEGSVSMSTAPSVSMQASKATDCVIESGTREEEPKETPEETPEEKAERKRRELKRKNEELAKKQAQKKQKKRF